MNRAEILRWLREDDPQALQDLYSRADRVRHANVGEAVHLRGLIEISNHCRRNCAYCGLHVHNRELVRYRMRAAEVIACVRRAVEYGYGTVVLQGGEDPRLTAGWVSDLVRRIKSETPLAVTLSLGEREPREFETWRDAGADRYLLRFETSDPDLYARIHPPFGTKNVRRADLLRILDNLGYEAGSGVMIGIPGQRYATLADDIALFGELDLDMVGVGPYIPHPGTRLGREGSARNDPEQVPASEEMTYRVVALTRLVCPRANIPSTSALATVNLEEGRELGLQRGANVVMPNLTPLKYRALYEIYPAKACIYETSDDCRVCMQRRIESIGREVGRGRGDARKTPAEISG